jgi:2-haloacid dehalogenase
MRPQIIAFDLNGTVLDMSALDPHFERDFGSPAYRESWFLELQTLWMTTIACGTFQPFEKLAKAALRILAAKQSIDLAKTDESSILDQMTELPAYADVAPALATLRSAGHRTVALTNGARRSAKKQLKFAGLTDAFEQLFAADEVEHYKPAPEPYRYAADELHVKPKKLLLVAAHAWDIEGAYQAGLQTAFVARPSKVLNPQGIKPDYAVSNLAELAAKLT